MNYCIRVGLLPISQSSLNEDAAYVKACSLDKHPGTKHIKEVLGFLKDAVGQLKKSSFAPTRKFCCPLERLDRLSTLEIVGCSLRVSTPVLCLAHEKRDRSSRNASESAHSYGHTCNMIFGVCSNALVHMHVRVQ